MEVYKFTICLSNLPKNPKFDKSSSIRLTCKNEKKPAFLSSRRRPRIRTIAAGTAPRRRQRHQRMAVRRRSMHRHHQQPSGGGQGHPQPDAEIRQRPSHQRDHAHRAAPAAIASPGAKRGVAGASVPSSNGYNAAANIAWPEMPVKSSAARRVQGDLPESRLCLGLWGTCPSLARARRTATD